MTGCAGFIGYHVAKRLLELGHQVVGVDSMNEYYDLKLKRARLEQISSHPQFLFVQADLKDRAPAARLFQADAFAMVVNLAAQAGVRYSLKNPHAYVDANVSGFLNVLEGCRVSGVKHLVFASSSSVYGANTRMPYSEHDAADHPLSLYAATKKANELMAHAYSHLYGLPATGLRLFTVYGPWGRPDMAMFLFTRAILNGEAIDLFNSGKMRRDFTYIDDVVEGVVRVMDCIPQRDPGWKSDAPDPAASAAPYRVYNLGSNCPVELIAVVRALESKLGRKAKINMAPLQPGDVLATHAAVRELAAATGFTPSTPLETGVERFVEWYKEYYGVPD